MSCHQPAGFQNVNTDNCDDQGQVSCQDTVIIVNPGYPGHHHNRNPGYPQPGNGHHHNPHHCPPGPPVYNPMPPQPCPPGYNPYPQPYEPIPQPLPSYGHGHHHHYPTPCVPYNPSVRYGNYDAKVPPKVRSSPSDMLLFHGQPLTCLPRQNIMLPHHPSFPPAKVDRNYSGVVSYSQQLTKSADALLEYLFLYGQERPQLKLIITGSHEELRQTLGVGHNHNLNHHDHHHHHQDNHIRHHHHHHHNQHVQKAHIVDFKLDLDISGFVSEQWSACLLNGPDLKWKLEEFVNSDSSMKEIECGKSISGWNIEQLLNQISWVVRTQAMYPTDRKLKIEFQVGNSVIKACSNTSAMKMSNSVLVQILCFLSCLWLIVYPIFLCMRSSFNQVLYFDYNVKVDQNDFIHRITPTIQDAVMNKRKISATLGC
ncbi:hypothetical protein MIR68_011126 [Amoeboaphelidium protococcarum]|nr:hypothetical protein MIR68_011126 [Amoeboaphelidium protococcarum]